MSGLWPRSGVGSGPPVHSAMSSVRTSNLADGGYAVREHASAADQVVCGDRSDDDGQRGAVSRAVAQDDRCVLVVGTADAGQTAGGDG